MICLVLVQAPDNSILGGIQARFAGYFWVYSQSESSNVWRFLRTYGAVAQLEERLNRTQEVVSSNLIGSTTFRNAAGASSQSFRICPSGVGAASRRRNQAWFC